MEPLYNFLVFFSWPLVVISEIIISGAPGVTFQN